MLGDFRMALGSLVVVLSLCANAIAMNSSCILEKPTPALNRTDGSPAGILKLLREGQNLLELREEDRDMVVFLGLTGSGKTTFTLYIGGYDDDLTSTETRPRSRVYIIEDRCNRSSSASKTLESHTLVPDRFVDTETKTTYFDLPGFSDSRPKVAYDIAATYFTKIVLDYARRIKLVFVVNYSHVQIGGDRGGFNELVDHITTLIHDLSKFKDSIAIIVSKVVNIFNSDSRQSDEFPYISDEMMVAGIADFLVNAKSFYLESNRTKAAQLMDILLEKKNDSFARIGLFRTPDRPGPLKNVTSLQRNKRNLKAIIDTNIGFTEKTVDDFGYTLSQKSKNTLYKLREEMLANATAHIRALAERIEAHLALRENSVTDLEEMTSVFSERSIDLTTFKSVADFTNFVETFASQFGANITAESMKEVRENEKSMMFLKEVSGEDVDWTSAIQNGTKKMVEFLRHSTSWYILFLNTMYDTFSEYDVQVRPAASYQSSLTKLLNEIDILRRAFPVTEKINLAELISLKSFLKDIGSETMLRVYDSLGPISLNERKLFFLQMVLNATLNSAETSKQQTSCKDEKFTAKGRHVLLTRIANELRSCPQARFIEIIASEKIFVDSSLDLTGKGVQLSMVAPVWVTIGHVAIVLDGAAGQHYETTANNGVFSSSQWMRNGEHGQPGLPGGPAGHFVGVGTDFINGDSLTIYARGGKGGNGENGGDGHRGEDRTAARPYNGESYDFQSIWPGYNFELSTEYSSGFWRSLGYGLGVAKDKQIYRIEISTPHGQSGGNGGNGGAGGEGGHRGTIFMTNLNFCQNLSVQMVAADGDRGMAGEAGKGAEAGRRGSTLVERYKEETYWWSDERKTLEYLYYTSPDWNSATAGFDGVDGANHAGQRSPSRTTLSEPDIVIEDFRVLARSNLPNSLRKNALKEMLRKLDNMTIMSFHFARACGI